MMMSLRRLAHKPCNLAHGGLDIHPGVAEASAQHVATVVALP